MMDTGIHMLEVAAGIKDSLINAGFTIQSLVSSNPSEIATILGIELYVAKIIFDAARKATDQATSIQATNSIASNGAVISDHD